MPSIQDVRQQYPQYDDLSDQELLDGFHKKFYSDIPQEDFYNKFKFDPRGEFSKGVSRSIEDTKALVTDVVPAFAKSLSNKVLGTDFDNSENLADYKKASEENAKANAPAIPSYKDIHSLDDLSKYFAGSAGEMTTSMATTMLGGGAGGFVAKNLARRGGIELTKEAAKKALEKGILIGATSASAPQNIGETYANILAQEKDDPLTALTIGSLKTGLDTITEGSLLGKLFGTKEASNLVGDMLLKKISKEAGKAALTEGGTEAAQEGLDILAEHYVTGNSDIFNQDNLTRLIDSGLKGSIGGAIAGGGAGILTNRSSIEIPSFKKANSTDVVHPVHMPEEVLEKASESGLTTESFSSMSPKEVDTVQKTLDKINDPKTTDLHDLTFDETQKMDNDQLVEYKKQLDARHKAMDEGKRTDQTFQPGDGEIVVGAPLTEDNSLGNSNRKVKVTDNNDLQDTQAKPAPTLPKELAGAKPRYKQAELQFPSDLEKALYISTPNSKSKKEMEYRQWLKDNHGLDDATINKLATDVKKGITAQEKHRAALTDSYTPDTPYRVVPIELPKAKGMELPAKGNLNDDLITPKLLYNNGQKIWGEEPLPHVREKLNDVIETVNRIANEVTGNFTKTKFFSKLGYAENINDKPLAGYQFANIINIALHNGEQLATTVEAAYHELGHILEENGFWSPTELAILDRDTKLLKSYMDKNNYLQSMDFVELMRNPDMRKELRANALGKAGIEYVQSKTVPKDLPYVFKSAFRKALNFIERIRSGLNGLGYYTAQDLLNDSIKGKYKNILETNRDANIISNKEYNETVTNMSHISQQARASKLVETQQAINQATNRENFKRQTKQAGYMSNQATQNNGTQLGYYGRFLSTLKHEGHKLPILGVLWESINRRSLNARAYSFGYTQALGDYQTASKETRYRIHSLADELRSTEQKGKLDEEGYLTFEREGKMVKIKDKDASRQYIQLQAAYSKVLSDFSDFIRTKAMNDKFFKSKFKDKDSLTIPALGKMLQSLDKEIDPTTFEKVNNLWSVLDDLNRMTKIDFSPRMRFGQYGIIVNDKAGEQVAFYTIENGSFNKLYNPDQMKATIKAIKEKYSDTTKYDVIGGDGKINNFNDDSIKPFTMSYNNLMNHIDSRYFNMDLLSSLLHTTGADPEALKAMKSDLFGKEDELFNDIMQKGFKKRFKESKNIDGYSRDWDRVSNAYLTGASHWLSGLQFKEELGPIVNGVSSMTDQMAKKKAESFLEYTNTPQEDFQIIRAMNYMWAMGANLSSALVQAMTLPTMTLGKMTAYDGNIINNMLRIGKWTSTFGKFLAKAGYTEDGIYKVNYSDENLNHFIRNGTITASQANFIKKLNAFGSVRAMGAETQTGEHAGMLSKTGQKISTLTRYLSIPLSTVEQYTRFATTMAAYEMFETNPNAVNNAKKMLSNDGVFQAMQNNRKNMTFNENAAMFLLDEAHGIYGREGRPDYQRGATGAVVFPFMSYPQHAIEGLIRDGLYRGAEGKRALAATLGAYVIFAGLMGIPGAEMIKEVLEELQKNITGQEVDYDLWVRERVYDATGSAQFAKFITQGFLRPYAGLSVGNRISLPLPGQDIITSVLGGQSKASDLLGVQGSMLSQAGNAWNAYQNGSGISNVLAAMIPNGPANLVKSYNYSQQGLKSQTEGERAQLISPEDMTKQSIIARAVGITSDQIATAREDKQFSELKNNQYKTALTRFRKQAINIMTEQLRAGREGDSDKVKDKQAEYKELMQKMSKYVVDHKISYNIPSFNKTIRNNVAQRLFPEETVYDYVDKTQKPYHEHLQKVLGVK